MGRTEWNHVMVLEVAHERNFRYEGLSVADIAQAEGKHPVDAFLDLALDEDLETEFNVTVLPSEMSDTHGERIKNPYAHISVSDGGAHTRFAADSVWPVYFLSHWIRDRELMTLEEAHYKMSALPARFRRLHEQRNPCESATGLTSLSTISTSWAFGTTGPGTPPTSPEANAG